MKYRMSKPSETEVESFKIAWIFNSFGIFAAAFSPVIDSKRFHLDTVSGWWRKICFTLVIKDGRTCYVERYTDSRLPFFNGRLKTLVFADCIKYQVNGVMLIDLVIRKLRQVEL